MQESMRTMEKTKQNYAQFNVVYNRVTAFMYKEGGKLPVVDFLFNGPCSQQPIDCDLLLLTYPPCPFSSL